MSMSMIGRAVNVLEDVGYIRLPRNLFVDGDVDEVLSMYYEINGRSQNIEVISLYNAFYVYLDNSVSSRRCLGAIEFYNAVLNERSREVRETMDRMRKAIYGG